MKYSHSVLTLFTVAARGETAGLPRGWYSSWLRLVAGDNVCQRRAIRSLIQVVLSKLNVVSNKCRIYSFE